MTPELLNTDILSVSASIASIALALIAIFQATIFFIASKRTETSIERSLAKIESETKSLTRITGKVIQPLTDYATTDRTEQIRLELFNSLGVDAPNFFSASQGVSEANEKPDEEKIALWIVIHHYSALLNFFAKQTLPPHDEYDPADEFDVLIGRIVDSSSVDYKFFGDLIDSIPDDQELSHNAIDILNSTRNFWSHTISTCAEYYSEDQAIK